MTKEKNQPVLTMK